MRDARSDRLPVYRRFLAGGCESLRLSPRAAAMVAGCGAVVLGVRWAGCVVCGSGALGEELAASAAAIVTAVLLAALAARWLGGRLGLLSGLVYLGGLHALGGSYAGREAIGAAAVTAAMAAFALASVPGRLPSAGKPWVAWAFYAGSGLSLLVAGPIGPAVVFAGCLLFLLANQDTRGLRFFARGGPAGLFLLVAVVWLLAGALAGSAGWQGSWPADWPSAGSPSASSFGLWALLGEPVLLGLPWTAFIVPAVVVGLRQGHYATPIWRFLACWVLGAIGAGLLCQGRSAAAALPPLAIISAAGLSQSLFWCRRRRPLPRVKTLSEAAASSSRRLNGPSPARRRSSSHQAPRT